jgi:hypothetical protein
MRADRLVTHTLHIPGTPSGPAEGFVVTRNVCEAVSLAGSDGLRFLGLRMLRERRQTIIQIDYERLSWWERARVALGLLA